MMGIQLPFTMQIKEAETATYAGKFDEGESDRTGICDMYSTMIWYLPQLGMYTLYVTCSGKTGNNSDASDFTCTAAAVNMSNTF